MINAQPEPSELLEADREVSIEYRATGARNGELLAIEAIEETNV